MTALAALAGGLLLLTVPGWLIARVGGLRGLPAASVSIALSCAVIGVSEIVASSTQASWGRSGWVMIVLITALIAVLVDAFRNLLLVCGAAGDEGRVLPAGARRTRVRRPGPDQMVIGGGLLLAVVIGGGGLWWGTGALSTPPQAFDAVFHLAAVQTIREGGDASSLGGLADLYQGRGVYYPTVFHGVAALLPGTASLASNALVLVIGAVCWPLGVMGLIDATVCTPRLGDARAGGSQTGGSQAAGSRAGDCRARALTLAGGALAAAATSAVAVVLTTLAAWPYALSLVCLPGVLALVHSLRRSRRWRRRPVTGLLTVVAAAGAVLAHGAAAFNLLVLLVPLGVMALTRHLRGAGGRRWWILAAVVLALLAAAATAWVMREALAPVLGYDRDGGSALATLAQALMDSPQYGPLAWHGPPVGLGLLALAAVAVRRGGPDLRLHLATWGLTLALVVLTGGPQWPGRAVGALWYLQKARVQPLVVIALLVLAGYGLHLLLRRWCTRGGSSDRRRATALVGATAVTALLALPLHACLAASIHDDERIAYGTLVTDAELAAQGELARLLPSGAVVVAAPSLGSTYLWTEHGVGVVYPTRSQPATTSYEQVLSDAPAVFEPGSRACGLLGRLGAEYYMSVERDSSGLAYGSAPLRWDEAIAAWPTTGMELLGRVETPTGSVALWRISACPQ